MTTTHARLFDVLDPLTSRIVACSGGIDSLLLATVTHRHNPEATVVAHTVTPAVPGEGTARVIDYAKREGWNLSIVRSHEFSDERYLSNPTDRCYFCKSHLYDAIDAIRSDTDNDDAVVLSGANLDDLSDYRPGLIAAHEHSVRHPYVEAEVSKVDIRALARELGLEEAELAASPCLASRLYTGTRVTPERLKAVEAGEAVVRRRAGIDVARCRLRDDDVLIEVPEELRHRVTNDVVADVDLAMRSVHTQLGTVRLDENPYKQGRAVLRLL